MNTAVGSCHPLAPAGPATPAAPVDPMLPSSWRIVSVRKETADTFTLGLAPVDDRGSLAFAPGQFNMLYVFGVGEVPISISGSPLEPAPLLHTTRAVGAVTRAMWKLKAGDVIGVRGPFGSSWPVESAQGRDVVIVAGGIGLAPLRSVLLHVLARRAGFGKVVLLYGTRTPEDLLFRAELRSWARRRDLDVHITVDRATGRWRGNVGMVTTLIGRAPFEPKNAVAFVCGPEVMMRFVSLELRKRGVVETQIHLSLERNMKCAVGFCGHCQFGPEFICKAGPVFRHDRVKGLLNVREL